MSARRKQATPYALERAFLKHPDVVGVGVGLKERGGKLTNEEAVILAVQKKRSPRAVPKERLLPKETHGLQTDVVEVGEFRALPATGLKDLDSGDPDKPSGYRNPYMCGDEIGPANPTQAGTAGLLLRLPLWDEKKGKGTYHDVLLTNWHVLHDHRKPPESTVGVQVFQPRVDLTAGHIRKIGVCVRDTFPRSGRQNLADAALVEVQALDLKPHYLDGRAWDWYNAQRSEHLIPWNPLAFPHYHQDYNGRIRSIDQHWGCLPPPCGLGPLTLGMRVRKSGRTSGTTYGTVSSVAFSTSVRYHFGSLIFRGQALIRADEGQVASAPGDSGSVLVNEWNLACGLLFAGAESFYVANQWSSVFPRLLNNWEFERVCIDEPGRMAPAS